MPSRSPQRSPTPTTAPTSASPGGATAQSQDLRGNQALASDLGEDAMCIEDVPYTPLLDAAALERAAAAGVEPVEPTGDQDVGDIEAIPMAVEPRRLDEIEPGSPEWQERWDLVEEFHAIGQAMGGGSPAENEEMVPAELVERCVHTGNWDLVVLFVGIAGWGVTGLPDDIQARDPYLDGDGDPRGWAHHAREGKSLTDHDPWDDQRHGGMSAVHLDTSNLYDLFAYTRTGIEGVTGPDEGTVPDAWVGQGGVPVMRDRGGNALPWPEELVAPPMTEELAADHERGDAHVGGLHVPRFRG